MADVKVSLRYANSFLRSSLDKKNLSETIEDINFIINILNTNTQLRRVLESPVVKANIKITIISEIFKNKISKDSFEFIEFVINKNRVNLLFSILTKFIELCNEYNGIVSVNIKSATELSSEQKMQIEKKVHLLTNQTVRANYSTDASIIGGFIARIKDTVYDASLKHQLDLMRKEFLRYGSSLN